MDCSLDLLGGIPAAGDGGSAGGGVASGGSILTMSNNNNMSSSFPDDDDNGGSGGGGGDGGGLELGLGLCIGGGLTTKEESFRIMTGKDFPSSCSSSSSSSVNIPNSTIVGIKRASVDSLSPPNSTGVVGWPPIRKSHRKRTVNGYLSVKVNMDGTLIGRKVDLNSHSSYEMLAQTLEDMFHESLGSSRLFNRSSEFLLTYEDKDGDCMLVGDVPWPMFLSTVKRLRILKNPKLNGSREQRFP